MCLYIVFVFFNKNKNKSKNNTLLCVLKLDFNETVPQFPLFPS